MRRLVLVGGGHAHLGVLQRLASQPPAGWEVSLVSSSPRQIYSGMLPGWVAGHYALDQCSISLTDLAARAGIAFHAATIAGLDLAAGKVTAADGRSFDFDLLSLDIGSEPAIAKIAGAAAHAMSVRPLEAFVAAWRAASADWQRRASAIDFAIVGGGAAAVELAFAVHRRAQAGRHRRPAADAARARAPTARGLRAGGGRARASILAARRASPGAAAAR